MRANIKKLALCLTVSIFSVSFAQEKITLEKALSSAIENNYDIKRQRYAVAKLQIDSARDSLEQMKSNLQNEISSTLIKTANVYWDYFMAFHRVKQLTDMEAKLDERITNVEALSRSGLRTRNDLLTLRVNKIETHRAVENALVDLNAKKLSLQDTMGITDAAQIGEPEIEVIKFDAENIPKEEDINEEFLLEITEKRSDFVAIKKSLDSAEKHMRLAKLDRLPDATLNLSVGAAGTSYSNNLFDMIGSGFTNVKGVNIGGKASVAIRPSNNSKKGAFEEAEAASKSGSSPYSAT